MDLKINNNNVTGFKFASVYNTVEDKPSCLVDGNTWVNERGEVVTINTTFAYSIQWFLKCLFTRRRTMPGNPAYGTDLTFILKKSTNTADSNVSVVKDCIYEALKQFNAAVVDIEGVEDYKQLLNRLDVQRLAVENKKFTIVLRLYNQYNNQVTVSL